MTSSTAMTDEPATTPATNPVAGTGVDDSLPAAVRAAITAVHHNAHDLESVAPGPGAITVQVCSASELSYDPATWTTIGTYRAGDAVLLADRLVDALGESANVHTDAGVLVVTHTYTDPHPEPDTVIVAVTEPGTDSDAGTAAVNGRAGGAIMTTEDEIAEALLLTLHTDRVHELGDTVRDPAGNAHLLQLQQHWLLQSAIDTGVITYDRRKWGELALGAIFEDPDQHVIVFRITYDIAGAPNVTDTAETDYPTNFDDLDTDAQNTVPSTLVPDPPTAAGWLSYLVDALNELHRATGALVHGWPR